MGDFSKKISTFVDVFVNQNGYAKVLEGLQNTLLIAVLGLVIGIVIGTIVQGTATHLKRHLQSVCRIIPRHTDCSAAAGILLCYAADSRSPYEQC